MAKLLAQPPELFYINGRMFRLLRQEPYTRKDGKESGILVWSGAVCETCGEPFDITTGVRGFERSWGFTMKNCRTCCSRKKLRVKRANKRTFE